MAYFGKGYGCIQNIPIQTIQALLTIFRMSVGLPQNTCISILLLL
jgi:hypothetical protein